MTNFMTKIKFQPTNEQKKRSTKRPYFTVTLRAFDHNAVLLENIMNITKQKTASGAIFGALASFQTQIRTIYELEVENAQLKAELKHYKQGAQHFKDFMTFINYKGRTEDAKLDGFFRQRPQTKIPY